MGKVSDDLRNRADNACELVISSTMIVKGS